MGNTALEILKSSIGFLTTLPVKGDVDVLRRNLWIFPYIGLILGTLISIPAFFGFGVLCLILYIALEGINHVDGLADFGDAFFAPKNKKREAMKDVQTGAGGVAFLCIYFIVLYHSFLLVKAFEIVISQVFAKYSMLLLLTTSKPSWNGMGAYFMEFARKRDFLAGAIPLTIAVLEPKSLFALAFAVFITLCLKYYSRSRFGGVSGDVVGAANCLVFASCLLILSLHISTIWA
ncbi:MAG: adenosylcobinamide-GDP ribazoletransferase [Archaeoglobi archaeon]|jgi:adenosylcobinamide-GDP ribazoletransferase|nr:MAG: adenosylcobinamide-GDP ribazoletransferase [Archaeoglobi archaeon]TDA30629.1 MAG: adenosylcobinamide-GDP ribazoletransferase [Archaeoglobi archaeon]